MTNSLPVAHPTSIIAIDTPYANAAAEHAPIIKKTWGVQAVGLYLFRASAFKQALTLDIARTLHNNSIKIFAIWESGDPTSDTYFHDGYSKGYQEGEMAGSMARAAGQPNQTRVFATIDYDPTQDAFLLLFQYIKGFSDALGDRNLLPGVYGSGAILDYCKSRMPNLKTYLSESTGYTGYQEFYPHADIVQESGDNSNLCPHDRDLIRNPEGIVW